MTEQQLQMGELEYTNGDGSQPVPVLPSEDQKPQDAEGNELPAPAIEAFDSDEPNLAPLAYGDLNPLAISEPDAAVLPSLETIEGATSLLSKALPGTDITPDSVAQMLRTDVTSSDIDAMWKAIENKDEETRGMILGAAINNPKLQMDAKLNLLRKIVGGTNANVVQQVALANTANVEADDEELEDSEDFRAAALEFASELHGGVNPYDESEGPQQKQAATLEDEIRQFYAEADANWGWGDFLENIPAGSLPTLNKTLDNIYSELGLQNGSSGGINEVTPWAAGGTALANLRRIYGTAAPERKQEIARVILKNLKHNSGMFQDSNDLVVMHVLDNVFHKELHGVEFKPGEFANLTDKQVKARDARMRELAADPRSRDYGSPQHTEYNKLVKELPGAGTSELFDNIFNLLDAAVIGAIAKQTISMGSKWLPKSLQNALHITPNTALREAGEAALDPATAARLGVDQKTLIESFLASGKGGANGFVELNARQADASETLLRMSRPQNLTALERSVAHVELGKNVGMLLSKPLPAVHVNLSTIEKAADGNGAIITAVFGRTRARGWGSLGAARRAARDAIDEVFGVDAPVEIVAKNAKGELEVVDAAMPDNVRGNFFQRVVDERPYSTAPDTYGALKFHDDTVSDLALGATSSTWTSALNVFHKFTYNLVSSRVREWRAVQGAFRGQLRAISDLGAQKQQLLSKIVKENEGKVLSDAEVRLLSGNDEAIVTGYKAYRHVAETMYTMADKHLRNLYLREGLSDLRVQGVRIGWGKPLEAAAAEGHVAENVFDPIKGVHRTMSVQQIRNLYKKGHRLATMRFPVQGKGGVSSRIVVLEKDTSKVLPIPIRGVMPKIPGYYPHITQGNYFVVGRGADGARKAIGVAYTKTDAADYVKRRTAIMAARAAKGKPTMFKALEVVDAPEMTALDDWAASMDEIYQTLGGPVYGKRDGAALHNLSPDFGATELDPIAALVRGTEIVSGSVTKGELVSHMRTRLYNFLRTNKGLFVNPETPAHKLTAGNIAKGFSDVRKVDKALAYFKQIDLMESSPDAWRSLIKGTYRRMAHYAFELANRGIAPKGLARKAQAVMADAARVGGDPAGASMGWLHRVYVAANALNQFALQASQSLVAFSYSPRAYMSALRQHNSVLGGVALRLSSLHGGKLMKGLTAQELKASSDYLAKIAGMSVEEFTQVVEAIVSRGLIDSVAHNTAIKDAIGEAAERAMKAKASSKGGVLAAMKKGARIADQNTFGLASRMGFQAGEDINQVLTFLTLYARDKAKGVAKLGKSAYLDDLIGRTAHITGNMVKEASPAYTRSLVKPLFQWIQFQHKMVMMTMPAKFGGSRILSGEEKARMALTQFLLFGTKATAATALTYKLVEEQVVERLESAPEGERNAFVQFWRSDEAQQAWDGLIFDFTLNKVVQAIWGKEGKDGEFAWSKEFAPGAGQEFLAERLVQIFGRDREGFFGTAGKYASAVVDYASTVRGIAQAQLAGVDDVPFQERAEKLFKQGLSTALPMYGRYLTAKWVMEHDAHIAAGGQLSEGLSTDLEAKMHFALGLDPKDRASYYEAMDRLEGQWSTPEGEGKEVQDIADTYWRNLVLYGVKLEREAPSEEMYDTLMMEHIRNQGLLFSVVGARNGERINEIVMNKLQAVMNGEGDVAEQQFVQRITSKLARGEFGDKGPRAAVYMRNLEFVKNNPSYLQMVEDAYQDIVNEPLPENMTTEEIE